MLKLNPWTAQLVDLQAAASSASSQATRPHHQHLPSHQLPRNTWHPSSAQPPSMHQRTPAPSFIHRHRPPGPKPNPALLTSAAPPLKCAPPEATNPLHNGSKHVAAQARPHAAAMLIPFQRSISLQAQSQEPREALSRAIGSSSSKHGSAGFGCRDRPEPRDLLISSQASGTESTIYRSKGTDGLSDASQIRLPA